MIKTRGPLVAEDLARFGWNVEIDEAADTCSVTCPKCGIPAFRKSYKGLGLDEHCDVAHVFRHSVDGASKDALRALTLVHKIVMIFGTGELSESERLLVCRCLGESLRGVAPDEVCDELVSAVRW